MLTLKECKDYSGLRQSEIDAIAEHEHIPELEALELGSELLSTAQGRDRLRTMIEGALEQASQSGDSQRAAGLRRVLSTYDQEHPDTA